MNLLWEKPLSLTKNRNQGHNPKQLLQPMRLIYHCLLLHIADITGEHSFLVSAAPVLLPSVELVQQTQTTRQQETKMFLTSYPSRQLPEVSVWERKTDHRHLLASCCSLPVRMQRTTLQSHPRSTDAKRKALKLLMQRIQKREQHRLTSLALLLNHLTENHRHIPHIHMHGEPAQEGSAPPVHHGAMQTLH